MAADSYRVSMAARSITRRVAAKEARGDRLPPALEVEQRSGQMRMF